MCRRAEKAKSQTSRVDYQKKFANKPYQISEYGHTTNQMFATFLRFSQQVKEDKSIQKREKKWNTRFALPISNYNEVVFRKYKLLFD